MTYRLGRRDFLKAAGAAALAASAGRWRRAYAAPQPMHDVIVLLPGIMGSVLKKDGRDLWAPSAAGLIDAFRTLGHSIDALKLTHDAPDVDDLGDGVTADRLFPDVHLFPGLWKIDGYTKVARRIKSEFAVEPEANFFEFPYDWRRDNRVAARRLARKTHDWLRAWRTRSGNEKAKLILIAHSMGGLVSRYFLECLDGWRDTKMLITFGTPYAGSLNALDFIANGFKKQLGGLVLADLTNLLRSFTSVYQLLPIYPCYAAGDGKLVRVGETPGIPGVDATRAAQALAFHREIEHAVDAHRKDGAYLRDGYAIHPIVGTYQTTSQSAQRSDHGVKVLPTYPGRDYVDGDGTVPRSSATPIELSGKGTEVFVAEIHGSLQNADPALVQVAGLLSPVYEALRGPLPPGISLSLDDAYAAGEPIRIRSRCQDDEAELAAVVVDAGSGREVARSVMRPGSGDLQEAECPPLPEGTYRATVSMRGTAAAVSDVFVVSGA